MDKKLELAKKWEETYSQFTKGCLELREMAGEEYDIFLKTMDGTSISIWMNIEFRKKEFKKIAEKQNMTRSEAILYENCIKQIELLLNEGTLEDEKSKVALRDRIELLKTLKNNV